MPMQTFFIFTESQRSTAMGLDADGVAEIDPRAVDNVSPGAGINLNDAAGDHDPGEAVTLTGKYVAPRRIVDDPAYQSNCPGLIAFLLTLPWASLQVETIFAPVAD